MGLDEPLIGKPLYLAGETDDEMRPLTPDEMADAPQVRQWQQVTSSDFTVKISWRV